MNPSAKEVEVSNENGDRLRAQLAPLLFLVAIFLFNFIARVIISPLSPAIERDMHISHAEVGTFFFYTAAGYFISLVGSGFVSSRITHKWTVTISGIAAGIILLTVCFTETVAGFGLCMFVLGLVTGLYLPSGIATITSLVNSRQWGAAIAVHELAPNLALVAAPLVAEALMFWFSWRCVLAAIGVSSLATGLVFALFGRGGEFKGAAPHIGVLQALIRRPSFFILVLLFSMGIMSTIGIYSMLPLFLVSYHEIPRVEGNTLIAISRISALLVVFIAGYATDHFGAIRTLKIAFILAGTATILLGIAGSGWIRLFVIIQPAFAAFFFPAGFALLSSTVSPPQRNILISLVIPVAFMIGAGLAPAGIGFMGDAGIFEAGFIVAGIFMLTGTLVVSLWRGRVHEGTGSH